jgi:hypothetical protein
MPHDSKFGIVSKVINRIMARLFKRYLDRTVPQRFKKESSNTSGINKTEKRDKKFIVSLTSFPARVDDIWIAIETILRQSFKPDAIILWLSEEQFEGIELPASLTDLERRGLTIRFVPGDIRSHKKYKYALEEFPNDYIITLDDDLYYDKDLLQNLVDLKKNYPKCVPTNRAHKLKFDNDIILPYNKWFHNSYDKEPNNNLVQTITVPCNPAVCDFDTLTDLYDKRYKCDRKIDRKNFINTQYVLYQFLNRHKFPCKKEDFNLLISSTIIRNVFNITRIIIPKIK